MKKLFAICVLVFVALSVFASNDVSIRLGGAFDYLAGRTSIHAKGSEGMSEKDFSSLGLGFNVGAEFDLSKNVLFYIDFSMAFPSEMTIGRYISPSDVDKALNTAKASDAYKFHTSDSFFYQYAAHVGFGHKFDLSTDSFELRAGAGFGVGRIDEGYKMVKTDSGKLYYYADFRSVTELSLGLYGNARYKFSENFAAVVTVMPDLGFFTIARHVKYDKKDKEGGGYPELTASELAESSGFALSFAVQATIGISYTF